MSELIFPFETSALRVKQRLGDFYVAALPVDLLLRVAASDRMRASLDISGVGYSLLGTQRIIRDDRIREIADYINRTDSAFPNSIILAANYDLDTGFDQGELEYINSENGDEQASEKSRVWTVTEKEKDCFKLTIPTESRLAAVIDGQHRLFSFVKAEREARESMFLLCSIYIDLPKALQAQIFATINSTQKRVDRSLTYELFGYNVSDEEEKYWTPDKLAVFFSRKLATDSESPLRGRIAVAPKIDSSLEGVTEKTDWRVSTAVIVDGILRLYSSNPKRDANSMRKGRAQPRSVLNIDDKDRSPLRSVFIEGNDALIYKMVFNYMRACNAVFWDSAKPGSYIFRTVGVQAVFDILRKLAMQAYDDRNVSVEYFKNKISAAGKLDFSEEEFKNASGSGRTYIRKAIEKAIGISS
jgi:DNA phosphorothioation-associated DGQHR protein 1